MDVPGNRKTSRNEPCPCGSGRKYKRCCMQSQTVPEDPWLRQHEASGTLAGDLMRFAGREFGNCIEDAWQDFNMTVDTSPFVDRSSEDQIFMPYFLFDWDPGNLDKRRPAPGKGVVLQAYRLEKAGRISLLEQQLLDQTAQPLSFHEVLWSRPGERMATRDILTGQESEVIEHSASRSVKPGDIIYAQVCTVSGLKVLGRCSALCIPPGRKATAIALRKKLQRRVKNRKLVTQDLIRATEDIRKAYLNLRDALYTPPRLCNTDGDPLVFHTLTYKIESAGFVFEALAPLAVGRSKESLLSDAELDDSGKILSVEFAWLKLGNRRMPGWDNTVLGHIKISQGLLVAEVNSKKRAERIRKEIEKRLGIAATHQYTVAKTPEQMLEERPQPGASEGDDERHREILNDPEVRRQFQKTMQAQLDAWVHQKIPILNNRTPMQAVGDPDGREIVESLLLDWERRERQPGIRLDFDAVRERLDLPRANP